MGKLTQAPQMSAPVKVMRQVLEGMLFAAREQTGQTQMDDNGINVTAQISETIRNAHQMRYVMSFHPFGVRCLEFRESQYLLATGQLDNPAATMIAAHKTRPR